jgi:hypothetical protein
MHEYLTGFLFLISRYLHIVCTTLVVGGTLFYEMVVPVAIGELKSEQQLLVFGRARWMFRSIVWTSAALLIITGIGSTIDNWDGYRLASQPAMLPAVPVHPTTAATTQTASPATQMAAPSLTSPASPAMRADWWWVAHVSTGTLAVLIALSLTVGASPPARPVQWMRINLIVLLIVIFLGTATRQVRQFQMEHAANTVAPASPRVLANR